MLICILDPLLEFQKYIYLPSLPVFDTFEFEFDLFDQKSDCR